MLSPQLAKVSTGLLMLANRLAIETDSATPLRNLPDERQLELVAKARDLFARYREQ